MYYRGTRRRREREKGIGSVFEEVIPENFSNLGKEIFSQTIEVHRSLNTRDPRRTTPRHIIIKMAKIKDKERLKSSQREK